MVNKEIQGAVCNIDGYSSSPHSKYWKIFNIFHPNSMLMWVARVRRFNRNDHFWKKKKTESDKPYAV